MGDVVDQDAYAAFVVLLGEAIVKRCGRQRHDLYPHTPAREGQGLAAGLLCVTRRMQCGYANRLNEVAGHGMVGLGLLLKRF